MKNSIYLLFLFAFFYSCESFLDKDPLDAVSSDEYWKTAEDLENYVIQYYTDFSGHANYDNYGYEILAADNAITTSPNETMNGERGTTSGTWTDDWELVRSVNIFFDNYTKCEDDFDAYKQYLGEAYFFRAKFYYYLVKKYGDVPWYSSEIATTDEEALYKARDPRTLVVDSILVDLDKAAEYLEYRSEVGNNRLNKETALAFKTRVALFEGSWQKYHADDVFGTDGADPDKYFQECVDAAEELMNDANAEVGIYDDYYEMFGLDDMSNVNEVLLYKAYGLDEEITNDVQYLTTYAPYGIGITWSLVSAFLDKNGEPYDYLSLAKEKQGNDFLTQIANDIDPRFRASVWAPGDVVVTSTGQTFDKPYIDQSGQFLNTTGFQLKKCSNPDSDAAGGDGGGNSETGFILFRYGEVLINYAEALYELKGEVATDALNQLRSRVGMPDFSVNSQSSDPNVVDYGYTISDELYEIRRERQVELALEGQRVNDYRRWAAHALFKGKRLKGYPFNSEEFPSYNPSLDDNGLIDYLQDELPNGYQFREERDYLSSIPADEITLNPNLEQNPGW